MCYDGKGLSPMWKGNKDYWLRLGGQERHPYMIKTYAEFLKILAKGERSRAGVRAFQI